MEVVLIVYIVKGRQALYAQLYFMSPFLRFTSAGAAWRYFYDERWIVLCLGAETTAKQPYFHDAKISFHNVKNAIAQHHELISFSEISFRIAKINI